MFRTLSVFLVLALGAAGGWLGRGWFPAARVAEADSVSTCRVARGRMEQYVKAAIGYVKPAPNALLRLGFAVPKEPARPIRRLAVQEGEIVSPGALLALLDAEDLDLARQQLTAELGVTASRLETLKKNEPLEVRQAEALLAERTALRDQAQRHHQRKQSLHKDRLVGNADIEDAARDLAIATARCTQAEISLEHVRARFRTEGATLDKQIRQSTTALEGIDAQRRWRELRSPLAVPAQVFAVHQRQGELAGGQPQLPVVTLLDPTQLQAHLYIAEADFGRIQVEQPVSLRAAAYPERVLAGRIIRLLPQPVLQENVVYYLAVVEVGTDQRALLRVDMSVTAHVKAGVKEDVLWLPLAAIRSRPDGWYVLRRGAGGPAEAPVRLGWQEQGRVEVCEGLAEGDEVVVQP
jgi:HlyD family secretion protein/macrolide-specific efflux system membrane fusion protein